jgi:hypothetical protein
MAWERLALRFSTLRAPGPGAKGGAVGHQLRPRGHKGEAVSDELPGVEWQRCIVHFMRNILSHVPASAVGEVAEDLKAIFKVRKEKAVRTLAEEFVSLTPSASGRRSRCLRPG